MESRTSFIEPYEEKEAYDFIKEQLGFEPPRPCGYMILVKLYVRPEELKSIRDKDGREVKLYLPDTSRAYDPFNTMAALVLAMGPEAYKHERFKESGPLCKIGDWVVIPRHEGTQILYNEHPVFIIPDDRIFMVIPDPSVIRRA